MRQDRSSVSRALLPFALGALLTLGGCDEGNAVKETVPPRSARGTPGGTTSDGGAGLPGPGGADAGPGDCYLDPKTHEEIINACTDAVKIAKNPSLPLLLPDGGLPPLP